MKYNDRFVIALQSRLGPKFTVQDLKHDLVAVTHESGAMLTSYVSADDKRKPVYVGDVERWVETATHKARMDLTHFTLEAQAQMRALLADIPEGREW